MFVIVNFETSSGNYPIIEFLKRLEKQHKQREINQIRSLIDALKKYGPTINENFRPEAVKKIREGLYELRPGQVRIFFFF